MPMSNEARVLFCHTKLAYRPGWYCGSCGAYVSGDDQRCCSCGTKFFFVAIRYYIPDETFECHANELEAITGSEFIGIYRGYPSTEDLHIAKPYYRLQSAPV